jgi:polyhydroxybutyrate depolymerase
MLRRIMVFGLVIILGVIVVMVLVRHRQAVLEDTSITPGTSTASTTSTTPVVTPSVATNTASQQPPAEIKPKPLLGESTHEIVSGSLTRQYTLYVPKQYDPAVAYPVVVLIHGGNGSGNNIVSALRGDGLASARFLADTNFASKAEALHFIVVAPEGFEGDWTDGRTTTDAAKRGIDDVAFITAAVREVGKTYHIDYAKIYSTGVSNGGTMSYRLACDGDGFFAAVAGVSASIVRTVGARCTVAIPVLGIQGTADPLMTFDGGPSKYAKAMGGDPNSPSLMAPAMDNMQLWAKNNGCNLTPTITRLPTVVDDGTSVDKYTFTGCKTARAVEYYVVNGMGHTWPPYHKAVLSAIAGPSSANINATDVVTEFLLAHSK